MLLISEDLSANRSISVFKKIGLVVLQQLATLQASIWKKLHRKCASNCSSKYLRRYFLSQSRSFRFVAKPDLILCLNLWISISRLNLRSERFHQAESEFSCLIKLPDHCLKCFFHLIPKQVLNCSGGRFIIKRQKPGFRHDFNVFLRTFVEFTRPGAKSWRSNFPSSLRFW